MIVCVGEMESMIVERFGKFSRELSPVRIKPLLEISTFFLFDIMKFVSGTFLILRNSK